MFELTQATEAVKRNLDWSKAKLADMRAKAMAKYPSYFPGWFYRSRFIALALCFYYVGAMLSVSTIKMRSTESTLLS